MGADGDRFGEEALACADALYNFARHLCGDAVEAEDLVQETYARAFAAAGSFAPGTNLKAWMMRILRNLFFDQRRRGKKDPASARLGDDEPALDPTFDDAGLDAFRRVVADEVAAALATLSDDHRAVLLMDLEGLTETEVAAAFDCSIGTVKSRLSRARAALRARLASR